MNTRSTAYNNGMNSEEVCASRESTTKSHHGRIIFPSLHGITINTHHKSNVGVEHQRVEHQRGKSIDNISPTDVIKPAPVLRHANSLDGLMIPMPKLSINDTNKSNEEFFAPKILNQRTNDVQISSSTPPRASEPLFRHSISGGSNFDNAKSSSRSISSTKSNVSYYGDARKHRTYYYPASVPTPISQKKSPSPSAKPKRLIPILRRRTLSLSPSTKVFSTSCGTEPTLASPDIIKTLHSHDNYLPLGIPRATINGDKKEGIGESEYGLERIRDCPKLIHRSKCGIKKSQSGNSVCIVFGHINLCFNMKSRQVLIDLQTSFTNIVTLISLSQRVSSRFSCISAE